MLIIIIIIINFKASGAGTNLKVGGTRPALHPGKIFLSCHSSFWFYEYNYSFWWALSNTFTSTLCFASSGTCMQKYLTRMPGSIISPWVARRACKRVGGVGASCLMFDVVVSVCVSSPFCNSRQALDARRCPHTHRHATPRSRMRSGGSRTFQRGRGDFGNPTRTEGVWADARIVCIRELGRGRSY